MTLVMPSGTLIDIPGNTDTASLELETVGATRTSVYVHLQSAPRVHLDGGDDTQEGIERLVQKIELSSNPSSATGIQSFKLAEFQRAADGRWSLSLDYLPPSLQVGPSPFFSTCIERMEAVVKTFDQQLRSEIQENHLAENSQVAAKQCIRGVFTFQALLVDLKNDIHPHPYEVFCALRALYIDVCIFNDTRPVELERAYAHEDLAVSLKVLLDESERLLTTRLQNIPYLEFRREEGLYVCEVDRNIKRARDWYLLVQKPRVAVEYDVAHVKLASPSRIQAVHENALRGIPFTRLEKPPFHHQLSSMVEFHAISPGMEWDCAIRDGKVALFATPQLGEARLYLYWREP